MEKQFEIDILCFLTVAKANKHFYKAHKPEIDLLIRVVRASINSKAKKPTKEKYKIGVSELAPFIIPIIQLVTELGRFLNSS